MYPAIVVSFYEQIMVYVRLQFVPTIDQHFSNMFGFDDEPKSVHFASLGYNSN